MKKLLTIAAVVALTIGLTGCATQTTTTTKDGAVTVKSKTDPLLTKQVIQEDTFLGIDLNVLGTSSMSPAKFRLGFGRQKYASNPTATNPVYAAPLNMVNHGNVGWFNQTADENFSTATNLLPVEAYSQPQISTSNPLLVQVVGTNGLASAVSGNTNAPAK